MRGCWAAASCGWWPAPTTWPGTANRPASPRWASTRCSASTSRNHSTVGRCPENRMGCCWCGRISPCPVARRCAGWRWKVWASPACPTSSPIATAAPALWCRCWRRRRWMCTNRSMRCTTATPPYRRGSARSWITWPATGSLRPHAPTRPSPLLWSTDRTHPPRRSTGSPVVPGCVRRHWLPPPVRRSAGWCHPSGSRSG